MTDKKQLLIIGGGPAGLAAAIEAKKHGLNDILIIERDDRLGGILNQCIHNGAGMGRCQSGFCSPKTDGNYSRGNWNPTRSGKKIRTQQHNHYW